LPATGGRVEVVNVLGLYRAVSGTLHVVRHGA